MRTILKRIACLFVLVLSVQYMSIAQSLSGGDPYGSFNRSSSITNSIVVTNNSVRQYTIPGDATVTTPSTFVWKVKGGKFVTDASGTTVLTGTTDLGNNEYTYSTTGDASKQSQVFIKWDNVNDDSYIAVYEETSYGCYNSANPFRGFKVSAATRLDIWLAENRTDICSGDNGVVRIEVPNPTTSVSGGTNYYYPMKVTYNVTDKNGNAISGSPFEVNITTAQAIQGTGVESSRYFFTLNRGVINVGDVTQDDFYTLTLTGVTDPFKAVGSIINDTPNNKFESHRIDVRHLPQTNAMIQN
jgi:hypothetical protein